MISMPTIIVDDDKVLRFLHALLDPTVPPARAASLRDFLSFDIPDVDGWVQKVQSQCGMLYPSRVLMIGNQPELQQVISAADAVVVQGLSIGQAELERAERLKAVIKFGVDTRNIDLEACAMAGVEVCPIRRRVNGAVAEHAIALMLAVGLKICETDRALDFEALQALGYRPQLYDQAHVAGANWARVSGLKSLQGATLGALGFGEVGREVGTRAKAMGMEVLYHQRTRVSEADETESGARYVSFDELLARADFLSVHLPHNASTEGLVDAKAFGRMKPGAVLVNISRAPIVDRDALIDALANGSLGGAGLDVHFQEPTPPDDIIKSFRNVVLTPHIAVGPRHHAVKDMEAVVAALARAVN